MQYDTFKKAFDVWQAFDRADSDTDVIYAIYDALKAEYNVGYHDGLKDECDAWLEDGEHQGAYDEGFLDGRKWEAAWGAEDTSGFTTYSDEEWDEIIGALDALSDEDVFLTAEDFREDRRS